MSSFDIIQTTLAADTADNGTFTLAFPSGKYCRVLFWLPTPTSST